MHVGRCRWQWWPCPWGKTEQAERTADGHLAAEWLGAALGFSHWLAGPEMLAVTSGDSRGAFIAGDPETGETYLISNLSGESVRFSGGSWAVVATDARAQRRIPLPAPLQEADGDSDPDRVGRFRVTDGSLWYGDQVLLPDRGMTTSLHESPSKRWVLVRQRQPPHMYIVFSASTDGTDQVEPHRAVPFDQLPVTRPQPRAESPNGAWMVRYGRWVERFPVNGIGVFHRSGGQSVWNAAPLEGPWWSPDSDRFVYIERDHLVLADLDGATHRLVRAPFAYLGWSGDRVLWLARGVTDH